MKRVSTILLIMVGVCAVMGTGAWSYVRTGWRRSVDVVKETVPIEFEIDRARTIVHDLVPEIRRNMHVIAREEVEVEQLSDQVAESSRRLSHEQDEILRLKEDLAKGKDSYEYTGKRYSAEQVRQDLATRFERFKTAKANHDALLEIQDARERSLGAAQQKIEQMVQIKRQLEVDVEHLETKLHLQDIAQSTSGLDIDASKIGQARQVIADIETRLKVAERVLNAEATQLSGIQLDQPQADNIVAEISEYFSATESANPRALN